MNLILLNSLLSLVVQCLYSYFETNRVVNLAAERLSTGLAIRNSKENSYCLLRIIEAGAQVKNKKYKTDKKE